MKHSFCAIAAIAGLLFAQTLKAQDSLATQKHKRKHYPTNISLGPKGLQIIREDSATYANNKKTIRERKREDSIAHATGVMPKNKPEPEDTGFESHFVILDLGFNTIQDKTNYNSAEAKNFLNVPAGNRNSTLFNLRTGKSINVNIYPFMETFNALNTKRQKINISTGIGLQLYNFRYDAPVTFTRNPNSVVIESTTFKKDKLAFDFLNIPLMVTFKTLLFKDEYLVYGFGITGGYNIATWIKQESSQYGKVKVHDNFDFATFNSCLTGEIGIENGIRFYASYQLTNLYQNSLNQYPITFGFRLFGI